MNECYDYLKNERKVRYLVHFTPIENIPSIMQQGICPRNLQDNPGRTTDEIRMDEQYDATSFSISFPNYKMFWNKRQTMQYTLFAVLLIRIEALLNIDIANVAYCSTNAACNGMRIIPFIEKTGLEAVKKMFEDNEARVRERYKLPLCYTTDPQAEVLIRDIVPFTYVDEIHVDDYSAFISLRQLGACSSLVRYDETFFQGRKDYEYWRV